MIRRELDRQLTVMVLVQVVFNSFATIPYIILYIIMRIPYMTIDPYRYAQLQLASAVFVHMYYLHYAVWNRSNLTPSTFLVILILFPP